MYERINLLGIRRRSRESSKVHVSRIPDKDEYFPPDIFWVPDIFDRSHIHEADRNFSGEPVINRSACITFHDATGTDES